MTVICKGTTLWVALIIACLFSVGFCSGYFISITSDGDSDKLILGETSLLSFQEFYNGSFVVENQEIEYISETCDYLFWTEETTYYAKNGLTGNVEYYGSDLAKIVESIVSSSSDGLLLCFKPGFYFVESTIDIVEKDDIRIVGAGRELTKFCVESDFAVFNVTGNPQSHNLRFELSDCSIDGGSVLSTKAGVSITDMDSVMLHDLDVTCFDTHVYLEDCQKPSIYNVVVWSNQKFSYGFHFLGYNLDIKMHEVTVLHSDPDAVGILFDTYDSIELSKVYVNPTVTRKGTGSGFVFVNCHFVHLLDCIADGNGNAGYYLSGGFGYYFTNCWSGTNLKGLLSVGADQIQINSCQFYSNSEAGAKIASANQNIGGCTIIGSFFLDNSMYGLELENTNHTIVNANQFRNNGIYGIYYSSENHYALITNNDATDNLHQNYDIYVETPVSGGFLVLDNNFGRVYVSNTE